MTRSDPLAATFAFGDFELDWSSRELRKRGKRLRLAQQPLHALVLLVNAGGRVVTREDLRRALWEGGTFVDFDRAINKAINQLRQLLGDDVERPRFIQTVPKCGYRFVAPVARASFQTTKNPQVREALLKARHFRNKLTGDGVIRSVDYFRQAIEHDPLGVDAWAGLAQARATLGVLGLQPPHDAFRSARAAAERALALNDAAAEAHIALGEVYRFFDWDWTAAEASYRRAIALAPDHAAAHQFYAMLLSVLARHEEALAEIERARQCDPLSVPINATISYIWCEARQPDRAVAAALKALEIDSNAPLTHMLLGRGYMLVGEPRKAIASLTTAARLSGHGPVIEANLAYAHARTGSPDKARRILDALTRRSSRRYVSPVDIGLIRTGLGDTDAALTALEDGFRARAARMLAVGDRIFAELSPEPRYRRLLADLHLPLPSPPPSTHR
jgi:DNA-binding winged helix-turn-helix (wHTH) protein/tetratricopeptide (TPR) repeat protein